MMNSLYALHDKLAQVAGNTKNLVTKSIMATATKRSMLGQ